MSRNNLTLAKLQELTANETAAGKRLTYLFDDGEFTELDKYVLSGDTSVSHTGD